MVMRGRCIPVRSLPCGSPAVRASLQRDGAGRGGDENCRQSKEEFVSHLKEIAEIREQQ